MSTIMDYKRDVAQRGTNKNTIVASRNIPSDIAGARLIIWHGQNGLAGWGAYESVIRSVNGRNINLVKELTGFYEADGGDPFTPHPGNPFYITGALALLDAPGEYYFDKQTNLLYFYPSWNGRPDQRTLSVRHLNNIAIMADNTSFVNIKNINIYGGGISMQNSRNNTLENCRINYAEHFYDSGWHKAKSDTKSSSAMIITGNNNRILKCEFGPTAGHGIVLEGDDNVFINNIVHTTGYSGIYAFGVCVFNSKRLEISHNTFTDTSKSHVFFYDMVYERCIIRNNYFENHSVLSSDASPIYSQTAGTDWGNTEIYHNFIVCGTKGDNG
ncbi:MAG: right-handed parallel beta-helix repeat-containing protein, partial [Treponema sp.]|nr:right-handed parallel beta-helix repeat-containing protein [Treponema sp.]